MVWVPPPLNRVEKRPASTVPSKLTSIKMSSPSSEYLNLKGSSRCSSSQIRIAVIWSAKIDRAHSYGDGVHGRTPLFCPTKMGFGSYRSRVLTALDGRRPGAKKGFREKITRTTADRPKLAMLMKVLAPGDVVIWCSMAASPGSTRSTARCRPWRERSPAHGVVGAALLWA